MAADRGIPNPGVGLWRETTVGPTVALQAVAMLSIRTATTADLPQVVALWAREGGPTRSPGGETEARRLLSWDPDSLLLAEESGELVGALVVGWDGWRAHLYRLAVEPSARRHGIARALVAEAVDRVRRLGASRLDAMVDPGNRAAIQFWEAAGFALDVDRRWSLLA